MPLRLLRDGILSSDRVNLLSEGAEVFYRRLMSVVDDYGRYDGRTTILITQCYPLRVDKITPDSVVSWLKECVAAGLVISYTVNGKPFVQIEEFGQRIRSRLSKWPEPELDCGQMPAQRGQVSAVRSTKKHSDAGSVSIPIPISISSSSSSQEGVQGKDAKAPTLFDVNRECLTLKLKIDAEAFWDHYTGHGWPRGDWRSLLRSWGRRAGKIAPKVVEVSGPVNNTGPPAAEVEEDPDPEEAAEMAAEASRRFLEQCGQRKAGR